VKGAYLTAETHLKQLIDYEECQWYRRSAGTTKRVHHEAKFRVSCRLGDCWCVGVRAASERIRRHIQLWAVAEAQDLHESGAEPCDHHAYCRWFGDREHVRGDAHLVQDPNIWHLGSYAFGLQELCCLAFDFGTQAWPVGGDRIVDSTVGD